MKKLFIILLFISSMAFTEEYVEFSTSAYELTPVLDDEYVNEDGDVMRGDLDFDGYKIYFDKTDNSYLQKIDSENIGLYINSQLIHTWTYEEAVYYVLLETDDYILYENGTDKMILE